MTNLITSAPVASIDTALFSGERWFDPIEDAVRARVRGFIEELLEQELDGVLQRPRYQRKRAETGAGEEAVSPPAGHRHGHRERSLLGSFGPVEINVPRARLETGGGATSEWKSQ